MRESIIQSRSEMWKFNQISCIDGKLLNDEAIKSLSQFSRNEVVIYKDLPKNDFEKIERIGRTDCVLLGFKTSLSAAVLKQCSNIKYIGLCCTLFEDKFANVDLLTAKKLGITLKGVTHYGDTGSVEFLFSELIAYMQGIKGKQWKQETSELRGKNIGIIGMGRMGKKIADIALAFGMNVYYFSRTRKIGSDYAAFQYLPLRQLLQVSNIISFHVPRKTKVLNSDDFKLIRPGSILANLSIGLPFDIEDLSAWLNNRQNFAIVDSVGMGDYKNVLVKHDNVSIFDKVTGLTQEAKGRLSRKVVSNISDFLQVPSRISQMDYKTKGVS